MVDNLEKNREFSPNESGIYVVKYKSYGTMVEDIARWSACGNGTGFWEFFGDDSWTDGFNSVEIIKKINY